MKKLDKQREKERKKALAEEEKRRKKEEKEARKRGGTKTGAPPGGTGFDKPIQSISGPTNFKRELHIGFNPETGMFEGLPPEWKLSLAQSGLGAEELREDPQALVEVMRANERMVAGKSGTLRRNAMPRNPSLRRTEGRRLVKNLYEPSVSEAPAPPVPSLPPRRDFPPRVPGDGDDDGNGDANVDDDDEDEEDENDDEEDDDYSPIVIEDTRSRAAPVTARALYTNKANNPGDLSFKKGDVIQILNRNGNWWLGINEDGVEGRFSRNYVEVISDGSGGAALVDSGPRLPPRIESAPVRMLGSDFRSSDETPPSPRLPPRPSSAAPPAATPSAAARAAAPSRTPPVARRAPSPSAGAAPGPARREGAPRRELPPPGRSGGRPPSGNAPDQATGGAPARARVSGYTPAAGGTEAPVRAPVATRRGPPARTPLAEPAPAPATAAPASPPSRPSPPTRPSPPGHPAPPGRPAPPGAAGPPSRPAPPGAGRPAPPGAASAGGDDDEEDEDDLPLLEDLVSEGDPRNFFSNLVEIGKGASGSVYRAKDVASGDVVAIKQMVLEDQARDDIVLNEIMIMQDSRHPNIVNFVNAFLLEGTLWVAMELVEGGALGDLITKRGPLKEAQVAVVCRHTLEALEYLHTRPNPIIHRDIKGDNILIGRGGEVKLTDFGFGAQLGKAGAVGEQQIVGTTNWMAPEVCRGRRYDMRVDIWSLGVMATELFDGEPPYANETTIKTMFLIATKGRPPFQKPDAMSDQFKDFVTQCTIMDPEKRPDSSSLMGHPFLKQTADLSELLK
jgi:hypothetical protein